MRWGIQRLMTNALGLQCWSHCQLEITFFYHEIKVEVARICIVPSSKLCPLSMEYCQSAAVHVVCAAIQILIVQPFRGVFCMLLQNHETGTFCIE